MGGKGSYNARGSLHAYISSTLSGANGRGEGGEHLEAEEREWDDSLDSRAATHAMSMGCPPQKPIGKD